jgi:hypothetical protein
LNKDFLAPLWGAQALLESSGGNMSLLFLRFLPCYVDDLLKSSKVPFFVIPAKPGIRLFQDVLDPGFRRGDGPRDFLRDHLY